MISPSLLICAAICLHLLQFEVVAVPTTATPPSSSTDGVCTYKALLEKLEKLVDKASIEHLGDIPAYAATSCDQIAELRPEATSGRYWIQEDTGPTRVYCAMEMASCGEGVWMQVANVNMTETSSKCPVGLEKLTSPKSLCRKTVNVGCSSAKFSTHNVPFTKVCGRVIGYQFNSVDAFNPYYYYQGRTIDDLYVEGVSITHSSVPRQHIFSFAAAMDEVPDNNLHACPCTNSESNVAYTGLIPEFIGDDYYCETGSRTRHSSQYYLNDPLWDGSGCGRFSSCCEGEKKPWFYKDLFESVTSAIEVRVCTDDIKSNEDVLIEIIELYVQ